MSRKVDPICCALCHLFLGLVCAVTCSAAMGEKMEIGLTNAEFKKLDTFEAHVLNKADQVFAKEDYKRATAEYDSFILEFPRSNALGYALMRKGRSLHHRDKRYEAIREYQQVVDYRPNDVRYAAAAQTYIGWCHWENGDEDKALKAWAKVAADKDYARQTIAAGGLYRLAIHHRNQKRYDRAMAYFKTIAVNFRTEARHVAQDAIKQVAFHYVRRDPNEPALRAFYKEVGTFRQHRPREVDPSVEELLDDWRYWRYVRGYIRDFDRYFNEDKPEQRKSYFRYWAQRMDGRRLNDDDYQIDLADFKRQDEQDVDKWYQRLDEQFERGYETGNVGRVIHWITLYHAHEAKWREYYGKLNLGEMENAQLMRLIDVLFDRVGQADMAANAFGHIDWSQMTPKMLDDLRGILFHRSESLYMQTCQRYPQPERGKYLMLQYHHRFRHEGDRGDNKKGIALAAELVNAPDYAESAIWLKGDLHYASGQWEQAKAAYQQSTRVPDNMKMVAECYLKMKKPEAAIRTLREIENYFKKQSSWAAYKIANIYRDMGKKEQHIAELRGVMKKYPGTREFSDAHRDLEKMGIKIGGYVEAQD